MGAWGHEIFDDDTAYDVMDELKRCADVTAYLERAFDTAADADYLEYDEGISALVCGAVLDSVVNGTGYRFDGFNIAARDTGGLRIEGTVVAKRSALSEMESRDREDCGTLGRRQ
ncbi:MAG: DUF4259 domain-containing protein [Gracilibacteraceae bacterium]|jgi:hypothetical protein|nr:DUF4259 domain-containing protein [Gracilibacteraceae bacterium]